MQNKIYLVFSLVLSINFLINAQDDSTTIQLQKFQVLLKQLQQNRFEDSLKKAELQYKYSLLKSNESLEKERVQAEFRTIEVKDSLRKADMIARANYLKKSAIGYPVTLNSDTLFKIYTKIGASTPKERAVNVTKRIKKLYDDDFFKPDSLISVGSENTVDIVYGDLIIVSISELDALINNSTNALLAKKYVEQIKNAISVQKEKNGVLKILLRIGLMILVVAGIGLLIWLIGKGHIRTVAYIIDKKDKFLKNLTYKDYTFLTADQELKVVYFLLKLTKWFFVLVLLYLVLPIVFSIFPFTRGWANLLFGLVWSPLKGIFISIWDYLPNLFSILVIYFVMKYVIRFVKYVFSEIKLERLKIAGFHPDWAQPTFGIVRFLLYAFMFVLVFKYLPGSDSKIFQGVSVFIGVLFSLGSSSAIANMVAGLVITYMRPFKIGDRIKIGDITGDVIEKNMLVTRLRTIKNEEITIPNSSVLSGNTINYSSISKTEGLIIHTTVTIGYDIPWKDMHQALIDAALKTDMILKQPKPFVLQTSLDDFYVSYQINAYTKDPASQAQIYSELHKNIQDVCNERGLEILSPHYRSERDGNMTTIPADYLPKDYKAPEFNVKINTEDKK
jgi:small-conductance mechanosensitive channel